MFPSAVSATSSYVAEYAEFVAGWEEGVTFSTVIPLCFFGGSASVVRLAAQSSVATTTLSGLIFIRYASLRVATLSVDATAPASGICDQRGAKRRIGQRLPSTALGHHGRLSICSPPCAGSSDGAVFTAGQDEVSRSAKMSAICAAFSVPQVHSGMIASARPRPSGVSV